MDLSGPDSRCHELRAGYEQLLCFSSTPRSDVDTASCSADAFELMQARTGVASPCRRTPDASVGLQEQYVAISGPFASIGLVDVSMLTSDSHLKRSRRSSPSEMGLVAFIGISAIRLRLFAAALITTISFHALT